MTSKNINAIESFETTPIPKLVVKNSIPALIAMIMVMVYNFADIFFISMTHDDLQVAAVSLATPLFMIFMSLGTMFGVGGTSVISRAIGSGNMEHAKKTCSFCMWACVAIGLIMTVGLLLGLENIMRMLGASENTHDYTRSYLSIAAYCGVFSMISTCFSSVIRSEGQAMKAMTGMLIGNLLNIILDPIMILGLNMGITGAAVATVIGNVAGAMYYILYFLRGRSSLSISPKYFTAGEGILKGVLSVGISASLANLLSSMASIIVNAELAKYGDMYVAGYGVTSKVIMVITLIGVGIGSGVQPITGYFYGADNSIKQKHCIRFSTLFAICVCFAMSVLCYIFAPSIVKIFLSNGDAQFYGIHFIRILMTTAWLIGPFVVWQNSLQAMGAALAALLASIIRQIVIFIPALFILNALIGVDGLIWAQPVVDVLSLVVIFFMLSHKLNEKREIAHKNISAIT